MSIRAMTPEEVRYMKHLQAELRAARQFTFITLGLVALPVGFVATALLNRRGLGQDPWAMGLSALILLALTAFVLQGSAKGKPLLSYGLREARLSQGLEEDIRSSEVQEEHLVVEAKEVKAPRKRSPDAEAPRQFFVTAGGRRFQVTGLRWMSLAVGEAYAFDLAPCSGILLSVEGLEDRLPFSN